MPENAVIIEPTLDIVWIAQKWRQARHTSPGDLHALYACVPFTNVFRDSSMVFPYHTFQFRLLLIAFLQIFVYIAVCGFNWLNIRWSELKVCRQRCVPVWKWFSRCGCWRRCSWWRNRWWLSRMKEQDEKRVRIVAQATSWTEYRCSSVRSGYEKAKVGER